jgi:cbb3-type cytochrome oxidase subunit 3
MYQEYFAGSDLLIWPLVGLVIFLLSFLGVMWYVLVGLSDRRKRDHIAALPLNDDPGAWAPRHANDEKGGSGA